MRIYVLYFLIASLAIYAWKDWYLSLCGLILLMSVHEHPEMPKNLFGIQGLNPWNLLLLAIIIPWAINRREEGLVWDMPTHVSILMMIFLLVVIVGFFRLLLDRNGLNEFAFLRGAEIPSNLGLFSEYFINVIKWTIPSFLLFDGCKSRFRFMLATISIIAVYFLVSIQVIKWMLPHALAGGDISLLSRRVLGQEIGFYRTDVSLMLAGGAWACFSLREFLGKRVTILSTFGAGVICLALILTAGRGGYIAWAFVGLALCGLRWKKVFFIAPMLVIFLVTSIPQLHDRIFEGLVAEEEQPFANDGADLDVVTAGRSVAWPLVLEKIYESPSFGYGRLGMKQTGIATKIWEETRNSAPHPHNAYLQLILDNGWIGALPILLFFLLLVKYSISLFCDGQNPIFVVAGGVSFSLIAALLVGGFTGQTFYPREASFGMWAAMGLMLRVWVDRENIKTESGYAGDG